MEMKSNPRGFFLAMSISSYKTEYICRVGLLNKKTLFLHSQLSF